VCKRALIGLNKASADEIEPYLHIMHPLMLMNDPYRHMRLEWLLGVP